MPPRLVLASASPARLLLLQSAGLSPEVMASNVGEEEVDHLAPAEAVLVLAARKARAVATSFAAKGVDQALVVGCDSLLEFDGAAYGKAVSPDQVIQRWRLMRGHAGLLHTGHYLIDTATGQHASETDTAVVRFGMPSDLEIEAYATTAEALSVAGPFTLEGLSAPWIDSIDGNYGTITGISLAVLRRLLLELNVEIVDLWS